MTFPTRYALLPAARQWALAASILFITPTPAAAQTFTGSDPVKIFILAGESNMHGKGTVSPDTKQGTLDYITLPANDPTGKYQFLKSGGTYVTRADVGIRSYPYWSKPDKIGNLTINYGGFADGLIGPELGFGHVVGDAYENKVLIVKVGVDATTLAGSYCPPSSRVGEPEPVIDTDKGYYYQQILRRVNEAKTFLGTTPYEIVGLAWHQGYNDRVQPAMSAAYETNMANFINDIRSSDKGIGVPNLPIVIATVGIDGLALYPEVERAQLKMADPVAYPAFAGNVAVVDTRKNYEDLEFWQPASKSPANENYHWNKNGKSYLHIGMAMGDAMLRLVPGRIPYYIRSSSHPGGTTLDWKHGTEMPNSVRVLRDGVEIAAAAPVDPPSFVDPSPPLGISTYELQFTMSGSPAPSLTIKHNTGVTQLAARLRVYGAHLSWQNNLGYAGLTVKRGGVVIATLPGSDTSYIDPAPPAGTLSYTVEPTTPGSIPAQASLRVSAHPVQTAVIYEPFDMTDGALLEGKKGGLGLDGNWSGSGTLGITAGSLSYGSMPTYGNRLLRGGGNGSASIQIGTTLVDAGLMADGAVLWFSFVHQEPNNGNCQPAFLLGNSTLSGYYNEIESGGSGIGLRLSSGKSPQPILFNAGTYSQGTVQGILATSQNALIVGKITWGANPSAPDTIQIYSPGTDLVLDTPTSHSAVLDQSTFSILSIWGNTSAPEFDEIRFGATYQDVIGQGVNTTNDFTPPTPATMSFATPPSATSMTAITMTATTASDANGVQYQFVETSGNPGATSSDWQDSPTYTDTGLNSNTLYTYTVQARDKSVNNNTNTVSSAASATTLPADTNPPPTPSFSTVPNSTSSTSITMTASAVTDPEGGAVEYFFDETSGNPGGTDSGWQSSPTYIDSGLSPSTAYTYTVKARDSATPSNESAASAPASATTQAVISPAGAVIYEPFDQAVGSSLNGQAGGTGLGNWTLKANTDDVIKTGSVSYGSLLVSGNQFNGQARYNNNAYPTLSASGLMSHGATLWFSAVIQPQSTSNRRFVFALSTADIDTGAWTIGTTGQCIGFNLQNGQDLEIATASAGAISRIVAKDNLATTAPVLVVGEIIWGADATAVDTIKLYLPGTNLTKPAVLDTSSVVVNQAAFDTLVIGYGGTGATKLDEIRFGATYDSVTGQGPGPLDHFSISPISSPQTVGTPITGITLTAQDSNNQTVASFTGTVTLGGSGGFSGTSANFVAGVLTGVSVRPTVAGSNLTLTVNDSSGKSGTATITTIQSVYQTWATNAAFDGDSNGDGLENGLAFLLGAADKDENASHRLPVAAQAGGSLKLTFKCLNATKRGPAVLNVQYSRDLGVTDPWSDHDAAEVPGNAPVTTTVGGVDFVTSVFDENMNLIEATVPASAAAPGTTLFSRLKATP